MFMYTCPIKPNKPDLSKLSTFFVGTKFKKAKKKNYKKVFKNQTKHG